MPDIANAAAAIRANFLSVPSVIACRYARPRRELLAEPDLGGCVIAANSLNHVSTTMYDFPLPYPEPLKAENPDVFGLYETA
ncbi:MAG: hypothetical protein O7I42_04240 [Alphaproteobacteria bacterium]|nr:hypothetical protein [Alphaproteobacteria bacterium]